MRIFKTLISVFIISILCGCAASGAIYERNVASTGPKITIFRQNSFVGKANCYKVLLNNNLVGKLQNGGYLTAEAKKGKNTITIPFEKPISLVININNNDEYYVEYSISNEGVSYSGTTLTTNFGIKLNLVEDSYAIKNLQALKESKSFCISL